MAGYLTPEEREDIVKAIDTYTWKHSWHLPTNQYGYTDWSADETIAKCLEVLNRYRSGAIRFASKCDNLVERLEEVQRCRAKNMEENDT